MKNKSLFTIVFLLLLSLGTPAWAVTYYIDFVGGTDTNACTLTVIGNAIAPDTAIQLQTGWNWVAYLPTTAMPIATTLASISGNKFTTRRK